MRVAALCLLGGSLLFLAKGLIIPAKAYLSVHLLNHAWARTLETQEDVKPWPWMDSVPVARLSFPAQDKSYVVLRGVSGTVLAFAPGWHEGTSLPGQGITLISAHRDTHFSIMGGLAPGDIIEIQSKQGRRLQYRVTEQFVTGEPELLLPDNEQSRLLVLVTCYPLDGWRPHSRQRHVTVARLI